MMIKILTIMKIWSNLSC